VPGIKSGAKGCRASTAYDGTVKSGNTSQKFPQHYGRMMSWNINQTRQNCQSISPPYFADANSSPKTHLFVVYSNIYGALKSRCSEQKNAKFPQSCLFARPKNTTCNGPVPQVGGPSCFADANSSPKAYLLVLCSAICTALKSLFWTQKNVKFPQPSLLGRPKNATAMDQCLK